MKKIRCVSLVCLIIISRCSFGNAQNIDSTLKIYGEKYEEEKAYLHYNKPAYSAGETIWFKAYLLQGVFPAEITKTIYVDWLDEKGNLLFHSVSPLVQASTKGQFDIPANYSGNVIHVRAYTKWMLNFDSAFFYNKDIRIISGKPQPVTNEKPVTTITFFPEGGDIIEGITNTIAFKTNDQWGRPVDIKGVIENGQGSTIVSFNSIHDGMGNFNFIPKAGQKYIAKWKDEYGEQHVSDLPFIKPSGISLQISSEGNKRYFVISRPPDVTDNLKTLYVLGTFQQHLAFKANINLTNLTTEKKRIPIEQLPTGIITVTAFDKDWNPLAERIIFVNNNDYAFNPDLSVQHWGLNKRARNELQINIPDSLEANLSVVVNDVAIGADSSENIFSHLLLTGDLHGEVYNSAYYFSNKTDSVSGHLDLVMLTHGWRKFKWQDVTKGKFPVITYPRDSSYLTLSGKVFGADLANGNNLVMILKQKDSSSKMVITPIHADGSFSEPGFVFFDTMTVYHQIGKSQNLKDASIQYMNDRLPAVFNNKVNKTVLFNPYFRDTTGSHYNFLLAKEKAEAEDFFKYKALENVIIQSKTKAPVQVLDEKYASGLFSGGDAIQIDLVNDPFASSSQNIFNYLQGRVAGLQINT
ncbi:MAG: hypothetical protein M3O67_10725, partial [Bacteroidota bacterium]|nr:hypothetical protein [Bacteroidota bacterium]